MVTAGRPRDTISTYAIGEKILPYIETIGECKMDEKKFEESQKPGGSHYLLNQIPCKWVGIAKTWFEPGKLAMAIEISYIRKNEA